MKAVVAAFNQEKALVGAFSVITSLRMDLSEALVEALVAGVRDWLWGHVVPATRDLAAAAILRGLETAAERKKTTSTTNREMAILVTFADLVVTERMVSLDLTDISKILRSNMFDKLPKFVGLREGLPCILFVYLLVVA